MLSMTSALKEIIGELSGLSGERQQVAASVIHALWAEENSGNLIHPQWKAELDRRNDQIDKGRVELISEAAMDSFVDELTSNEN